VPRAAFLDRAGRTLADLLPVAWLSAAFALLAFAWSVIGLMSPTTPTPLHEYSAFGALREVGGHILFGVVAGVATWDSRLAILCGAESILIDSDHILPALNLPLEPRLAHSISFVIVAPLVLSYLARRRKGPDPRVLLVTLAAISAHLSFDVFAGNGLVPLFAPFSPVYYSVPYDAWPVLEAVGIGLATAVALKGRRKPKRPDA